MNAMYTKHLQVGTKLPSGTPPHWQNITGRGNIVIHLPGVKTIAKNKETPVDCWKMFFSDTLINQIMHFTNQYINKLTNNYSCPRDCSKTDFSELLALIGLLSMAGVQKTQHVNVKDLWATDYTALGCFRATMFRDHFLPFLAMSIAIWYRKQDGKSQSWPLGSNHRCIRRVY